MAALNLTSKSPIFLTGNLLTRYADQAADLVLTAGTALRYRLYDMDPAALWQGDHNDDTIAEIITAGLWLPGMQSSMPVDFLAVLNHNLLAFDWDASNDNGATYPIGNQQLVTAQATANKIISLNAPITVDKLRLTLRQTQVANQFKQVGALVIAQGKLQVQAPMTTFKKKAPRVKDKSAKMHDNSTRRSFIYRSDASLAFKDFMVRFDCMTSTEADALEAIVLTDQPFIFYPEPAANPSKMYLGQAVPNTYQRDYTEGSRSGGEYIAFDFEEAGGA